MNLALLNRKLDNVDSKAALADKGDRAPPRA
jgi:hypothetical protein